MASFGNVYRLSIVYLRYILNLVWLCNLHQIQRVRRNQKTFTRFTLVSLMQDSGRYRAVSSVLLKAYFRRCVGFTSPTCTSAFLSIKCSWISRMNDRQHLEACGRKLFKHLSESHSFKSGNEAWALIMSATFYVSVVGHSRGSSLFHRWSFNQNGHSFRFHNLSAVKSLNKLFLLVIDATKSMHFLK